MSKNWNNLRRELERWADRGLTARLWVRDDDAHEMSGQLTRLHALAEEHKITVGLAVIPGLLRSDLTSFLGGTPQQFFPMCHGWKHVIHGSGKIWSEFGDNRPFYDLLNDAELAYNTFCRHFGRTNVIFVPPFGHICSPLLEVLPSIGFSGISGVASFYEVHLARLAGKIWAPGIDISSRSPVPRIDAQIDLIDWQRRTARDAASVAECLVGHLRLRRMGLLRADCPIGLLTHHLHHDEQVWRLAEDLLEFLLQHKAVEFFDVSSKVAAMQSGRLQDDHAGNERQHAAAK